MRALRVRDLLPRFPTSNNAVEWVKENVFSNAASPQTSEGSDKAESALTFTIDSAPVRTIAHWIPVSRQAMDDFAALRQYLEVRLVEGLRDKEDSQLLTGDGTGVNISGLVTEATAYNTGLNISGDQRIDKLAHSFTQLWESGRTPTGIVLHPRDWHAILLIKAETGGSNTGEYLMGPPNAIADPALWGVPVATSTAMTQGTFLVGDFRMAAVWDRMEAVVEISDSHSDYFIKNLLAVRAEERLTLTVFQSDAFIYGSF